MLTSLIEKGEDVSAVVTRPDRSKGRNLQPSPPPVKEIALKLKPDLPIYQPEKASTPEFAEVLKALQPDLFVVVAYGEIIKKKSIRDAEARLHQHPCFSSAEIARCRSHPALSDARRKKQASPSSKCHRKWTLAMSSQSNPFPSPMK